MGLCDILIGKRTTTPISVQMKYKICNYLYFKITE